VLSLQDDLASAVATAVTGRSTAPSCSSWDAPSPCSLGWTAFIEHRWDDAERFMDSAVAVDRAFVPTYLLRGLVRAERGDTAGLRADWTALAAMSGEPFDSLARAVIALRAGDSTALRAFVAREARELSRPGEPDVDGRILRLASYMVTLGEHEPALDWLERTRWRNTNFYVNLMQPPLDRLRGEPRYERLLDAWRIPAGVGRDR
jgi:hypothetical protein